MLFKMKKIDETDTYVEYEFETDIVRNFNKIGIDRKKGKIETVRGCCRFNKQTGRFELPEEKTDSYFLEVDNSIVKHVNIELIRCVKLNLPFSPVLFRAYG